MQDQRFPEAESTDNHTPEPQRTVNNAQTFVVQTGVIREGWVALARARKGGCPSRRGVVTHDTYTCNFMSV